MLPGLINLKDKKYGAVGDGVADDKAAIIAAIGDVPEGGTLFVPEGCYRHTGTIIWGNRINVVGVGTRSTFFPDVGKGSDGHVLGSSAMDINFISWRNIAILSTKNVRGCLVLSRIHRSRFENLHIRGAGRYDVHIEGCLSNFFNFIISINAKYEYPEDSNAGKAAGGPGDSGCIRIGPPVGGIATNANWFDLVLEGGCYVRGNTAQFYQEPQNIDGGNNHIHGTIEGVVNGNDGGRGIEIYGSAGGSISAMHMESNGGILLNGCRNFALGPGYFGCDM